MINYESTGDLASTAIFMWSTFTFGKLQEYELFKSDHSIQALRALLIQTVQTTMMSLE